MQVRMNEGTTNGMQPLTLEQLQLVSGGGGTDPVIDIPGPIGAGPNEPGTGDRDLGMPPK